MYGKHYASMYEGSMRGAGSAFFAVWGWIISHMRPDKKHGTVVEMNPDILAFVIGEKPAVVEEVIKRMCGPDVKSRSKEEEGRKLIQVGEYGYRVVNGAHYRALRDEEDRRNYQANWQATQRLIDKAVRDGGEIDLSTLTPAELRRYHKAKERERKKREKKIEHEGGCFGAQEAIKEGLERATRRPPAPTAVEGQEEEDLSVLVPEEGLDDQPARDGGDQSAQVHRSEAELEMARESEDQPDLEDLNRGLEE